MSKINNSLLPPIPTKVSELTNDSGYTTNQGTVTSVAVKMNGSTKGTVTTSGTIDLGTVITSHQSLSGYATETWVGENFLKLSDGTTPVSFNADNLPQFSGAPTYLVGIEAFGSGGTLKWQNAGNVNVGYADSAGNADTTDGLDVHSGRNNEANKIVRTDGSGYIQCGYINSSDGDENNSSAPARIWGTNGSDHYLRTYNKDYVSVGYASSAGAVAWDNVSGKPSFATVATSGSYNDLSNKPTTSRTLYGYTFRICVVSGNDNIEFDAIGYSTSNYSNTTTINSVLSAWSSCFGTSYYVHVNGSMRSKYFGETLNIIEARISSSTSASATVYFRYIKPFSQTSETGTLSTTTSTSGSYISSAQLQKIATLTV